MKYLIPHHVARASSLNKKQSGFTIIELIVVLGIMSVLTAVVVANYRSFNTKAKFANTTEDVVFALREAQVYGTTARMNTTVCGTGTAFDCAYGVHFSAGVADRNQIKIFVDKNDDKKYDVADYISTVNFSNSTIISGLTCGVAVCTGNVMDVTFKRPGSDAHIVDAPATGEYDEGKITLTDSVSGKTAIVTISSTGQISVQ